MKPRNILELPLTRVTVPVKVVAGVAVTLVVHSVLAAGGAVREGNVVVCDIVEEVKFLFLEHQTGGDGVSRL